MADDIRDAIAGPLATDPLIPGARDPHNLTHREPGAVGGQFSGGDIPGSHVDWLDESTAREHAREGGGRDGERVVSSHESSAHHATDDHGRH